MKRDGTPRVYEGRKQKVQPLPVLDYLLTVSDPNGHLTTSRLFSDDSELDCQLDRFDAANEDRWGRLPHEPGYGVPPLALVPAVSPSVPCLPKELAA